MNLRRARTSLIAPALLVAGLPLAVTPPAHAGPDILVGCTPLGLVLAFELANDANHPGPDTIVLSSGCTYTMAEKYGATENALPSTPSGSGITVHGNGAIIERSGSAPSMGVMSISGDVLWVDTTFREFRGFTGAYFHVGGSLQLVDSTITNVPPTGQQDSAIQNEASGTVLLQDSLIENQFDTDGGGGSAIDNKGFLATFDTTFRNNTFSFFNDPGNGGALTNSGTAHLNDTTFAGNNATATGGAIRNGGYLEIHGATFTNNGNGANFGGAIANSSDLVITDSYFESNDADIAGGAIYNSDGGITQVDNSTFHDNDAGLRGGAIENRHAVNVEHVTFSANEADVGTSINSELGGVAAESTIFAGTASHCGGTVFDFGENLVHPTLGSCPAGFAVGDPKLTAPALRGGQTKTLALGAGSAAVDIAGSVCPATDQRGFVRPRGAACDAGALENQPPSTPGTPALAGSSASPNAGTFSLSWTAATDPDGTPVTYRLLERRSDEFFFTHVTSPASAFQSFFNHAEGTWDHRVQASDGNLTSSSSPTSADVVVDRTAPSLPAASADRAPEYAGDGGWFADQVTVSFAGSTDPALVDGSAGSGVASYSAPQVFTTSGSHIASGVATDGAGNSSAAASLAVQVDATAPTASFGDCPNDVLLGATAAASWTASDDHSGLATPASGSIPLDTATIGTRTVSTTATDNTGHTTTAECTFRVVYDFAGFFKPVPNPPAMLTVAAGDQVVLKFSLGGDQGLGVLADGYPQSAPVTCGTSPELTAGDPTTSRRGLQFLPTAGGRYSYAWSTSSAWSGTCRQVILLLDDGTYHRANVRFS